MVKIKNGYVTEMYPLCSTGKEYIATLVDKKDRVICTNIFTTREDAEGALKMAITTQQLKHSFKITYEEFEKELEKTLIKNGCETFTGSGITDDEGNAKIIPFKED